MSTAALKRELALLRSSLAALTPAQSAALDDPIRPEPPVVTGVPCCVQPFPACPRKSTPLFCFFALTEDT